MTKPVNEMTPAELAEAFRTKAWRVTPPKPTLSAAETKRAKVRAMTDEQFRDALRRRAWRDQ